jgi:carboxylate-amine ligase
MHIEFAASESSTVGIEWELAIVDRDTCDLVPMGPHVLEALRRADGSEHPQVTHELLQNTVEIRSRVHQRVPDAVADLAALIRLVRGVVEPDGAALMCAGSHPFAQWFDQEVTHTERYDHLLERTKWWGRQMLVWGVHVHVGVDAQRKALPILGGLLSYYGHLQALSASSPFWAGASTGYASNRALMFQQLPTAGLPWPLSNWEEYEGYVDDLVRTGVIRDFSEVRWDVRPSPRWGTVEMRACDSLSTLEEIGAVSALIHCLVHRMSQQLDKGEEPQTLQPWFVRENKWRAARYGLEADVIVDRSGTQRPVREAVQDLISELAPIAEQLGCSAELDQVNLIFEFGASYQRQLRVAEANGGSLQAVVSSLAHELQHGLGA